MNPPVCSGPTSHVTARLYDRVPHYVLREWMEEREALQKEKHLDADDRSRLRFLVLDQVENYLDQGHGSCLMKNPEVADLVAADIIVEYVWTNPTAAGLKDWQWVQRVS
jgi:Fe-S cluster biosynthesis and repair protein YggX